MDLGLQDKVAIVTGGSDGIGKAAAQGLAQEGAKVVIVARRADFLEQAAQDIRAATEGAVLPVAGDVADPATAERVVQAAVDNFGGVDVMVNNAGRSNAKAFESVSDDDWEGDFNLKVWAAVRFIRAVIPHMRQAGGGRIINVTNLGGRAPGPASMPTSVSRAAGIAITKALSKDLAKDNILVSTVCIGTIKSGQTQRFYAGRKEADPGLTMDGYWAEIAQRQNIPLGRVGEAKEAGDVITFLASQRASYLTGIAVNIDGGASAVV